MNTNVYKRADYSDSLKTEMEEFSALLLEAIKAGRPSDASIKVKSREYFLFQHGIDFEHYCHDMFCPHGKNHLDFADEVNTKFNNDVLSLLKITSVKYSIANQEHILTDGNHILGFVYLIYGANIVSLHVVCHTDLLGLLKDVVENILNYRMPPTIKRLRLRETSDTVGSKTTTLPPRKKLSDVKLLYPYLDKGPAETWKEFSESDSNVILLIGEPGTGKSSFILEMLESRGWDNHVYLSDREDVLGHHRLSDYTRDLPRGSVLVTEDSDNFIVSREKGNSKMSSLLNTTSGIVSTDLKIIISTNLSNLASVDKALIRPGRTFKIIQFEKLTVGQAYGVRDMMELPKVDLGNIDRRLTLAEVINYDDASGGIKNVGKAQGFGFLSD